MARDYGIASWGANQCAAYGYRGDHARDATAIPNYNILGELDGVQIRPERPVGEQKYLWKRDHSPQIGGYPAGTPEAAERAVQLLHDLRIPIMASESILKNGSLLSHAQRDIYPLAIHGNWNWAKNGAPSSDLRWIPRYEKKHGKIVYRRKMVLTPDSNYWTKPEVARGWWEFGNAARGLGFDVSVAVVPHAPDGTSWGPDDALTAGATTVETLIDTALPLPGFPPAVDVAPPNSEINLDDLPDDASRIEWLEAKTAYLEAENLRIRHERAALIGLFTNPYLKSSLKEALVSTYVEVVQQEADEDGRVEVAAGKIGQDFRESVDVGEEKPKLNKDGSRFLIARSSVKSVISEAQELKLIDAVTVPREKKRKGQGLPEKVWRVKKPTNLAEFLASAVTFATPGVEPRKNRTQSPICPACGVRHSRRVDTICLGCGAVTDTKILEAVDLTPDDVETDVQHRRAEQAAQEAHSLEKTPKVVNAPLPAPAPPPPNVSLEENSKERKATRIPICTNCSLPRSSAPTPCPNCGAVGRTYKNLSPQPPPMEQAEMAGLPSHPSPTRWTS